MTKSPWPARVVIALAALASVATSQARWSVPLPTLAANARAQVVTIEASDPPHVTAKRRAMTYPLQPRTAPSTTSMGAAAPWTGSAEYILMPDTTLSASIEGRCAGGCFTPCTTPPGSFIRVKSTRLADTWKADATLVKSTSLGAYDVEVEASRLPEIEVTLPPGTPTGVYAFANGASTVGDASGTYPYRLTLAASGADPSLQVPRTWTLTATIEGLCADDVTDAGAGAETSGASGTCAVPPSEHVEIHARR